jgi:hypothetical protein
MKLCLVALAAFALTMACGTSSPPPEPPIVERETQAPGPFVQVCANLRAVGCPEGDAPDGGNTCAQTLYRASWIAVVPTGCLIEAGTPAEVRECGAGGTLRVRCKK